MKRKEKKKKKKKRKKRKTLHAKDTNMHPDI